MSIEERLSMGAHAPSGHSQVDYHQHSDGQQQQYYADQQQCSSSIASKADDIDGYLQRSATKKAAKFRCSGAVRKAGFLSVKKWILKRRQSIELARKRGWKRYWVCLRGTTLLFHSLVDNIPTYQKQQEGQANNDGDTNSLMGDTLDTTRYNNIGSCIIETEPRHLIILDGSIAQPVPEHPKRDHVFCLSTTFGDAYLFQSSCQLETDNWIGAIHNACAASLARDQGRSLTMRLITSQLNKITMEAELKTRLRHKLEMKLSSMLQCVSNNQTIKAKGATKSKSGAVVDQQQLLEDRAQLCHQFQLINVNLEQLHCESYQLRCYLASCKSLPSINCIDISQHCSSNDMSANTSLIGGVELPHPKTLLMHVSKPTKLILNKLGVFTVSSFHAYVCARAGGPYAIMNHLHSLLTSTNKAIRKNKHPNDCSIYPRERSLSSTASLINNDRLGAKNDQDNEEKDSSRLKSIQIRISRKLLHNNNDSDDIVEETSKSDLIVTLVNVSDMDSQQILSLAFRQAKFEERLDMNTNDYFIRLIKSTENEDDYIPVRKELVEKWPAFDQVRIEKKISYQIRLIRESLNQRFGFSVEAKLVEQDSYDELCVYCSRVEQDSLAESQGLKIDDEIMIINGAQVSDLDMMFIENTLHEELSLVMRIKSCRLNIPVSAMRDETFGNDYNNDDENNFRTYEGFSLGGAKTRGAHGKNEKNTGENIDQHDGGMSSPYIQQRQKTITDNEPQTNYISITDEYIASLVCPPPPPLNSSALITQSDVSRDRTHNNSSKIALSADEAIAQSTSDVQKTNDQAIHGPENYAGVHNQTCLDSKSEMIQDPARQNLTKNIRSSNKDKFEYQADSDNVDNSSRLIPSQSEGSRPSNKHESSQDALKMKANFDGRKSNRDVPNEPDICQKPVVPAKPNHVKEAMKSLIDSKASSKESSILDKKSSTQGSTNVERLRKSILEILETERAYVDHLNSVISLYMVPLKNAEYLQVDDIKQLSNTITDIASFQCTFHENLKQEIINRAWNRNDSDQDNDISLTDLSTHLLVFNSVEEFSDILLGIADTFLSFADKFKLYSTFCASYSKLQKLLHPTSVHQSNSSSSLLNDTFAANGNSTFLSHLTNNSSSSANSQAFIYAYKLNEFFVNLTSSSNKRSLGQKQNGINGNNSNGSNLNTSTLKKHLHQQHFESYLIKPIQRVVKYPLLISSLVHLAKEDSFEHKQLIAAMRQMEQVAGHINDMQRIHEEYGFIFDHLQRQYCQLQTSSESHQSQNITTNVGGANPISSNGGSHQSLVDLNVGELLYYGDVEWLNMNEFSGKVKKSQELHPIIFVFSSAVVFLCKERIRQKKKLSIPLTTNKLTDVVEIIRYQALIPVSEVQVRSLPASNGSSQQNLVKDYRTPSIVESASSLSLTTGSNVKNQTLSEVNKQSNDIRLLSPPTSFQWELFKCCPANVNAGLIANAGVRRADGKVYLFSNRYVS